MPALEKLSADEDPQIRSKAAYALGQIDTPAAVQRLEVLVDDPDADTRYNAAVALARRGNEKAVETLAEMLDLEELTSMRAGNDKRSEATRRAVIVSNALHAVEALATQNPTSDFTLVNESLERLAAANRQELDDLQIPSRAASEAQRVLDSMKSKTPSTSAESESR
jgi:HEAT repeat protein